MPDRSHRLERTLWTLALLTAASAATVLAWKSFPGIRGSATDLAHRVATLGAGTPAAEQLGDDDPPTSGPVRLLLRRSSEQAADPWMAPLAHGPDLGALSSLSPDTEPRRWTWEDVNSVPILRWEGDARVVKPGAHGRQYSVRGKVDLNRALAMERAFGYEIDRAVIRYRSDDELRVKRASLDRVLTTHGVVRQRAADGDVLAPDYEWMIEASVKDMRPIAQSVVAEARRRGANGPREEFGALASFVQQIEYGEAPNPGDTKHRFGLSMPLWALANNRGDCDTRAVMLVALARSINLCDVELVRDAQHQHMLAAAAIPVKKGDHLVRPNGRPLVLVETTDDWPVGHVACRTNDCTLETLFLASSAPADDGPGRTPAASATTAAPKAAPAAARRKPAK